MISESLKNIVHNAHYSMDARTSFVAGVFIGSARTKTKIAMQKLWGDWELDWDKVIEKISKYNPKDKPVSSEVREDALDLVNDYMVSKNI